MFVLTILFEGKFPDKKSSIRERFVMDNYYNKRGSLEKSIELADNLLRDIKYRVDEFKKHPNGKVWFEWFLPSGFRYRFIKQV